jgi:predicted nucleotidyltransferase
MSVQPQIRPAVAEPRVTPEKVRTALSRIIESVHPLAIVAFGSRARGAHRSNSDLDLLVLLDPASQTKPTTALWALFSDLDLPVDLIAIDEPQHRWLSRSRNSIHSTIAREGVILYDKRANGSPDSSAVERISR